MSGKLFLKLIEDERAGKYGGEDVQMVPHFTSLIQQTIVESGKGSDIHIVEIGGTVGDIESTAFMEAIREMNFKLPGRCAFAHLVYLPWLGTSKEFKTKPAQNALRDLRNVGIIPDLVLVRSEKPAPRAAAEKIAMFGGISPDAVILLPNARTVYEVPLTLEEYNAGDIICKKLGLKSKKSVVKKWHEVVELATAQHDKTVKIGIVAKYLDNEDTYFSVVEALHSAAWANKVKLEFDWVDAEKLEHDGTDELADYDGLLVPGGFGSRGLEGMILAARYAMDNDVPYLGICLGLQMAVLAAARKAGVANAQTSEVDPLTPDPVIYIMTDQKNKELTGGTMRLGNYPCKIKKGSQAEKIYGSIQVLERHRHRYEVNQKYNEFFENAGLVISGTSPDGLLVEIVEIPKHKFFVGTQAHPEFRSRPDRPHPLFKKFVAAAKKY